MSPAISVIKGCGHQAIGHCSLPRRPGTRDRQKRDTGPRQCKCASRNDVSQPALPTFHTHNKEVLSSLRFFLQPKFLMNIQLPGLCLQNCYIFGFLPYLLQTAPQCSLFERLSPGLRSVSCSVVSEPLPPRGLDGVCQPPPSIAFREKVYRSGQPFPSPGDLPNPGNQTQVSCPACGFSTT